MRFFIPVLCTLISFSCKKEVDSSGVSFLVESAIHSSDTVNGRIAVFSKFRMYLSNIRYVTASNDTIPVEDYYLFEYSSGSPVPMVNIAKPRQTITSVLFSIGLDKALNNSNPVTFPAGSPLSLDEDMYWGMLKYRFLVTEGAMDSSATKDGPINFPFSIHLGTDTLYRELSFPVSVIDNTDILIEVDPQNMFDGPEGILDMRDNFSNHSSPSEIPDGIKLMNNFAAGVKVKTQAKLIPG